MNQQQDQHEQKLYSLMVVAEEHQKAVKAAIDGLAIERAALSKERVALAQATDSVGTAAADVRKAAAAVLPTAQRAVSDAVGASVRESMVGATQVAADALEKATQPIIVRLSEVIKVASEAEGSMRNAAAWFAWRWVAVAAIGLAVVCLAAYASLAWQMHQAELLDEQKAVLTAEIAQLTASVDALEKRGGKLVTSTCGGRLCFEASTNQGKGYEQWRSRLWGGDKENSAGFVIPKGH